jgi:hypothetical protein
MSAPRFAVVQTTLEIPPVEKLRQAFRSVSCLTDYDAHIMANDAFGILVRNLGGEDALSLKNSLAANGIETELVAESQLPALPATRNLRQIDCVPEGLVIYDPLGRTFTVDWGHLAIIAAGSVKLSEFKTIETTKRVTRMDWQGHPHRETVTERKTREERNFKMVLELMLGRGAARYSIAAEKFRFHYLGDRQTRDTEQNFRALVSDLIRFSPGAAINRGAYYIRENAEHLFAYPTKNAFFEEITWLLWQIERAKG